ncbi:MAG TPA: transglutaminase domain-containing protein [Candidatus Dojkabacteria bacterium]|nr:transglutaminase domain-containing protein [Candidatus Dojkabacteria bacterium]
MKKLRLLLFSIFFALGFLMPATAFAKDVELKIEKEYYIDTSEYIRVIEKHTISNNSLNNLIDRNNTDKFQITHLKSKASSINQSVETARMTVDGREVEYTVEYSGESAVLSVKFPRNIGRGDSMTFVLEYNNFGLIEQTGALIDIYASGLAKSALEENEVQDLLFSTSIRIKKDKFADLNFVLPEATASDEDGEYMIYNFDKQALVGRSVWIQLGKVQYYKFRITQEVNANQELNLPFNNEYRLILPRIIDNAEIYQKVYYENILPLPRGVEKDADGNIFAYFELPGNQSGEIVVEGYVEVGLTDTKVTKDNSGVLSDYDQSIIEKWLQPAKYWEVDASEITSKAEELKSDSTNVFELINDTYNFVVDRIDYSQVKKFGINERLGALATLNNGAGVCMEYSDLFLTLMRAQGIPAQAVFGFGYDPLIDADKQEPHQWVQVYIPSLSKWLDIDVTWGENGEAAVGGYLNHFYTHIAGDNPEQHSEVVLTGFAIKDNDLDLPGYDISAVDSLPQDVTFMDQSELLEKYPFTPRSEVINFLAKVPQTIFNFLNGFSDQEKTSIVIFTIGFSLVLFPILYFFRDRIDFSGKKKQQEVITSPSQL